MNRLAVYRQKAELTQQELADKIGVSRSILARVETYTLDFKGAMWANIAKILECTTDELLCVNK